MNGAERIVARRQRQIDMGYTPEHDAHHGERELLDAAQTYAWYAWRQIGGADLDRIEGRTPGAWPWLDGWNPSGDPVVNLEKAGALIAAEIDRLLAAGTGGAR